MKKMVADLQLLATLQRELSQQSPATQSALKSAGKCHLYPKATAITGGKGNDTLIGVAVTRSTAHGRRAHFTGLRHCKSRWICPHCTPILLSQDAERVSMILDEIYKIGYVAKMVTLTIPHYKWQTAAEVLNNLLMCKKIFDKQKSVRYAVIGTPKGNNYASTGQRCVNAKRLIEAVNDWNRRQSIAGSKGNDTLSGGKANDTLTGNAGADVIYEAGNHIFTVFAAQPEENIKPPSGYVTGVTLIGNDWVGKTSSGETFTVKGGKGQEVTIGSGVFINNLDNDSKENDQDDWHVSNDPPQMPDYLGSITSIECRYSEFNGWHFHAHILYITSTKGADRLVAAEEQLRSKWQRIIEPLYQRPSKELGLFVSKGNITNGEYIAKELCKVDSNKKASAGVFSLLASDSAKDKELFFEYARAVSGHARIKCTSGLAALANWQDVKKKVQEKFGVIETVVVGSFTVDAWSEIIDSEMIGGVNHRHRILRRAELDGYSGIVAYCLENDLPFPVIGNGQRIQSPAAGALTVFGAPRAMTLPYLNPPAAQVIDENSIGEAVQLALWTAAQERTSSYTTAAKTL